MTETAAIVTARRKRLEAWIATHYRGVQKGFLDKTGMNQGMVSGLISGSKSFGEKVAVNIERKAGMPPDYLVRPLAPPADAPVPPGVAAQIADLDDTTDGIQTVIAAVLQTLSGMMPDAGKGLLVALDQARAGSAGSKPVIDAAVRAVERGLQSSVQAIPRVSPRGSRGKPPRKDR